MQAPLIQSLATLDMFVLQDLQKNTLANLAHTVIHFRQRKQFAQQVSIVQATELTFMKSVMMHIIAHQEAALNNHVLQVKEEL